MAEQSLKSLPLASLNHTPKGKFAPNNCANPNGRPRKGDCVSSLLRDLLTGNPQRITAKWKTNPTGAMIVTMALFKKMGTGDLTAIHEGLNRVEGRAPQEVTLAGKIEHKHEIVKFDNADLTDAFRALLECGAVALGNN